MSTLSLSHIAVAAGTTRQRSPRVLVTGAGSPAAVAFLRAAADADVELWAADTDPYAAGLYLVPADRRVSLPSTAAPRFADDLLIACCEQAIDVLVPTTVAELGSLASTLWQFAATDIAVLAPSATTIGLSLDAWALIGACEEAGVPVARTRLLDGPAAIRDLRCPYLVKPRRFGASRDVLVVENRGAPMLFPLDGSRIIQEILPGQEYSIDILAYRDGQVAAVVPRARLRTTAGIASVGATVADPELERLGRQVARVLRLTSIANIHVRRDAAGVARLLEVNPGISAGMPLTVASGVNMPALALDDLLGREAPSSVRHRTLGMIRTWEPRFVEVTELGEAAAQGSSSLSA